MPFTRNRIADSFDAKDLTAYLDSEQAATVIRVHLLNEHDAVETGALERVGHPGGFVDQVGLLPMM